MQADLTSYMMQNRFSVGNFNVKLERSAEQPDVRAATAAESGDALADLLASNHHMDQAKEAYAAIGGWQGEKGLAYLSLYAGKWEEARSHFARCSELGATDAKLYFDYAGIQSGEKRIDLLKKAVQLQPDYPEAHYHLGLLLVGAGHTPRLLTSSRSSRQ